MTTAARKIKVAIAGVGNCASALVQGIEYYRDADPEDRVPGLMHVSLGGYHVGDIEFVAAFDVDAAKVGLDLSKAVFTSNNNTIRFSEVPALGVTVQRGPTLDGLGKYYRKAIDESLAPPVDVADVLRRSGAEVLVAYLPVGSDAAQKHYATAAIEAGCAFVNAIPVFIASDPEWAERFTAAGLPVIGDDIKSQVGATIVHRILTRLMEDRGMVLDRTYQLNVGGNMDFQNMLERERLESKKISKTQAVTSQIDRALPDDSVHIGPSDYVPWLADRKWAYIRMEGRNFGDAPLNIELKLEVWDSPELGGRDHRRHPLRQDRPRPGPRRTTHRPLCLLHEVAAGAVPRRRGVLDGRGLRGYPRGARGSPAATDQLGPLGTLRPPLGPPGVEAAQDLLLAENTFVEADLQQELESGAHVATRRDLEVLHDRHTVHLRTDGVQLLSFAQLRQACLELVHAQGELSRLGLVAGRAVAACQLVQPVQKAGRRHWRSGARLSRSSPSCRCGSADGAPRAGRHRR